MATSDEKMQIFFCPVEGIPLEFVTVVGSKNDAPTSWRDVTEGQNWYDIVLCMLVHAHEW